MELIKKHKSGSIIELFTISFPMMISQGCETVMIFTDRLFMSRLGPEQMNATLMGGLTVFVMTTFFIGLTGYTNALVAQFYGAGQKKRCGIVVSQAAILSFIGYPLILAVSPLVIRYFAACGIAPEQLAPQKTYFSIVVFSTIITLLRNCLSGFFCGIGNTGYVMVAAALSMVINVGVDYVLIFGKFGAPALGIKGAALGTIIGGFTGLSVLAIIYLKSHVKAEYGIIGSLKYDKFVMGKLLRFGSPSGLEMFLNLVAFNLMIMIFHADSLVTATAASIVFNWDLVSFVPLIGVQIGVTSLVGRYMGAGSPDTAYKVTLSGILMGWCYSLMILILFIFFTEPLVDIFKPQEANTVFNEARPLAIFMVRLAAVYVMVDTLFAVLTGALRGAGDTIWAMIITVILHWVLVAILYIIINVLNMSAKAGWISVVVVFISFSMLILWRYSTGKWRKIKVVDEE